MATIVLLTGLGRFGLPDLPILTEASPRLPQGRALRADFIFVLFVLARFEALVPAFLLGILGFRYGFLCSAAEPITVPRTAPITAPIGPATIPPTTVPAVPPATFFRTCSS